MSNLNEEDLAKINEAAKQREMTVDVNVEISDEIKDFLQNNPMTETTVAYDLWEWSKLITELSTKEVDLLNLKDIIFDKEQWIIENTDFKAVYGKNNADVRKQHLMKHMQGEYDNRRNLEISIDYLKRRISYLKSLIRVKSVIMEVRE